MPLFRCASCNTIENTALSMCSWVEKCEGKPMLCSACCPKQTPQGGKWHGAFKREKFDPKKWKEEDGFLQLIDKLK